MYRIGSVTMTRAEIYKIRYQIYRDLGYSAKEARALRSRALDVSYIKINPKTKKVVRGKTYRNITTSMIGPKDLKKFVNRAYRVKNDTVYSRWGMLTQDPRYKDGSAKLVKFIQKEHNINEDQAYFFLYYMTTNKKTYNQAKNDLLSNQEFEIYRSRRN